MTRETRLRDGGSGPGRVRRFFVVASLAAWAAAPLDVPRVMTAWAGDETPAPPAPEVRATPRAPRAPATPPAAPASEVTPPAEAPEAPESMLELPEPPTRLVPRGWFGFGFQCGDCYARRGDSVAVWSFGSWPTVYSVDAGGPAARAGLRRGDVITHIDGVSIITPDGGRRFGAIRPGQAVRWTLLRDGSKRLVVARAAERPERTGLTDLRRQLSRLNEMQDLDELRRELASLNRQIDRATRESVERTRVLEVPRTRPTVLPARRLRYAGVVGGAEVEVRGPGSVIVSENDLKDELVITTGEAVVVIRVPESKKESGAKPKPRDR